MSTRDSCDERPALSTTWYHGSTKRFDKFQRTVRRTFGMHAALVPVFLTCDLDTARAHALPAGYVYTVEPHVKSVFHWTLLFLGPWPQWWAPEDSELTVLGRNLYEDLGKGRIFPKVTPETADEPFRDIAMSYYSTLESAEMRGWLKDRGFDAFYVREWERAPVDGFAVMDPSAARIIKRERIKEKRA